MADETKSKPDTSTDDGKKADGTDAGTGTQTAKTEDATKSFTQADLDRIAGEARTSEREKAKREKEAEDKKRAEKELAAQGKIQELADTRERERDAVTLERDDYKAKYETLAETVKKSVDAQIKELPEGISDLAPADLDARLEWLPKAQRMAEKLTGEPKPGNSRGPKTAGQTPQEAINDIVARKRASGQYSR